MSNCECPIAGWCERHKITKTEHWHKLCHRDDYFMAWEEGRGPGQAKLDSPEHKARHQRIKLAVEQRQRLLGWLQFFRLDTDRGVGDTANRINSRTGPRRALHLMLESLLKQCSCSRRDAVSKLNSDWPY